MKRLEVEPTEKEILKSIGTNRAGRNADIVDFIRLLLEAEGPYALMLDAAWGDGKTFFIKSVEYALRAMNPVIEDVAADSPELESIVGQFSMDDVSVLPFYFNAWENDYADDPITTLFACMAADFDRSDVLKTSNLMKGVTSVVDVGLTFANSPIKISGVAEALTSKSLIESLKARAGIRQKIRELAESAKTEVANKLVIFIDELDRCRPDFAVRLLEQTKSLFASESIILVFATDSVQLAKAVGGMYGPGFDTTGFLERFFDERVTMTPVDGFKFANEGRMLNTSHRFENVVDEVLGSRSFTIRDNLRLKSKLEEARRYCEDGDHAGMGQIIAACTILPMLIFIEKDDTALFRKITTGADFDALYDYARCYESFNKNIRDVIMRLRGSFVVEEQQPLTEAQCKSYVHDLCVVIYGKPDGHPKNYQARDRIGCLDTVFDMDVYKRLKFN